MEAHEVLVQELAGLDRPWRFYSFREMESDIFWFHSLPWYLPTGVELELSIRRS